MHRRTFLSTGLMAGGALAWTGRLPRVSAEETRLPPAAVRLHAEIEPLVRLLEDTPRERVLEEVAVRVKRGLPYRNVLAALFLAGVRNIQPRPIGFKFHAVLVVNSAHLASLASSDADRWLPIFWAIDQFKASQARDVAEGDWTLGPVEEARVPDSRKARSAFIEAMDRWDESAADAAVTGLARTAGANEIFELFLRYGVRDFREIGHKAIYIANSFRALEVIGWHHAEPVLRSLAYALLDRVGDRGNPAGLDLPADRPFRRNLPRVAAIRDGWMDGQVDSDAVRQMLAAVRSGSAQDTSDLAVTLLNRGAGAGSLFTAYFQGAGELLMQSPGILSLHATTFTNAVHYAFRHSQDSATRRLLLLQNAAFLPLFRGNAADKGIRIDALEPLSPPAKGAEGPDAILAGLHPDRLKAARQVLGWLAENPDPEPFAAAARRWIFLKGRDSHDYKFSSAVLEDYHQLPAVWRDRFLAASVFNLRGGGDSDNGLTGRIRSALGG